MSQCKRQKCGEFNMLRCVSEEGHSGDCCFAVDRENDYPWNKKPAKRKKAGAADLPEQWNPREKKMTEKVLTLPAVRPHCFRPRDPGGPPMGLGKMSARDRWRYLNSLLRYSLRQGDLKPLNAGEIGIFEGFKIIRG